MEEKNQSKLNVLWTSCDRQVALDMIFMYCLNSRLKGWWQEVSLIVWGPSAELLNRDEELKKELAKLRQAGVEILACRACADRYGVSRELEDLGIKVIYMGQPLTHLLKEDAKLLTV